MEFGADVNLVHFKFTALLLACRRVLLFEHKHKEIITFLLSRGAKITNSIINLVLIYGDDEIQKLILSKIPIGVESKFLTKGLSHTPTSSNIPTSSPIPTSSNSSQEKIVQGRLHQQLQQSYSQHPSTLKHKYLQTHINFPDMINHDKRKRN